MFLLFFFFFSFSFIHIFIGQGEENEWQYKFVFSIPYGYRNNPPHVYITSSLPQPILTSLTIPNTGYEVNTTVSQSAPADIRLSVDVVGIDVRMMRGDGKQNKTVIVRSQGEISVYAIDNENIDADGYAVYPSSRIGTEYYVAGYTPYSSNHPSFFCISSPYDNTLVNIRTKAGQSHSVTLMRYESYRFDGEVFEDLSGTFVHSGKPVAVISGVTTRIPNDVCCLDAVTEQLVSTYYWSTTYILSPYQTLSSGYIYRVYSINIDTTLSISYERNIIQLEAESFYEGDVTEEGLITISADQPIMVVQYMKGFLANNARHGDPSMVVIPPTTSFIHSTVTFPVIEYFTHARYYINVITNCIYIDGLLFDNAIAIRDWERLTTDDQTMCCVRGNVTVGHHSVSHTDSMAAFSVLIYATGKGSTSSYAYMASLFYSEGKMQNITENKIGLKRTIIFSEEYILMYNNYIDNY